MGHHTYLTIGETKLLYFRDGYDAKLAALFAETERVHVPAAQHEDPDRFGYVTTAGRLRQRLQIQGFTSALALVEVTEALGKLREAEVSDAQVKNSDAKQRREDEFAEELRTLIVGATSSTIQDPALSAADEEVESLQEYGASFPSVLRFLLDLVPDETIVGLDLHELIGCCVDIDVERRIAAEARSAELADFPNELPLIVLTEGGSDSRLLSLAMTVTHPHLAGFVKFIDFASVGGAEGSVSALARTVSAFIAAGVGNRFVAIADNDAEGYAGLAKLKRSKLPANCRVTHYPDTSFLSSYPTIGPYSADPILADINGCAGSLEMYLGRDVLTVHGELTPVQWKNYQPTIERYHGALSDEAKRQVQKRFEHKVKAELNGPGLPAADWSGVHAIMEHLIHAFG